MLGFEIIGLTEMRCNQCNPEKVRISLRNSVNIKNTSQENTLICPVLRVPRQQWELNQFSWGSRKGWYPWSDAEAWMVSCSVASEIWDRTYQNGWKCRQTDHIVLCFGTGFFRKAFDCIVNYVQKNLETPLPSDLSRLSSNPNPQLPSGCCCKVSKDKFCQSCRDNPQCCKSQGRLS